MTSFKKVLGGAALLVLGLAGPIAASAATSPSLGAAGTYGVVSDTYTNSNTAPYTIINGTVGQPALCYTTLSTVGPTSMTGTTVTPCPPAVGLAQGNAKADVNSQAALPSCTVLGPGAITLDSFDLDGAGPILPGHYPPGCYTNGGAMIITLGTSITLDGNGTHIFKPGGSLTTGSDSFVTLAGGASACDVFWAPVGDTTIGAYTGALPNPNAFVGNIFRGDAAGLNISLGHFQSLLGRTLAFASTVTTDANTITVPTCAAPPSGGNTPPSTINVVKKVVNDNGRTKTVADFSLFVNGTPVSSGVTNTFPSITGVYTVTETNDPNYTRTFSGDCDVNGQMNLTPGQNKFCIITNDDIGAPVVVPPVPPLIDVVKVPSPLSLPNGPGQVTYTYTARNIGTVAMSNVTLVGDTCSPIVRVSGDTDNDNMLDVSETWTYTCSTTLNATHTNTVVATGWANGISATDIASATVIVGVPLVPPLIHLTKVPSPLTLLAGGGMVTYTERISNPGTVALSNVSLTDDKCSMAFISGDTNLDSKLDTNETWNYTCQSNLTKTTTNTAVAAGTANGLTVRDFATATVVVAAAAPVLPMTGFAPAESFGAWRVVAAAVGILAVSLFLFVIRKKQAV